MHVEMNALKRRLLVDNNVANLKLSLSLGSREASQEEIPRDLNTFFAAAEGARD